MNDFSLRSLRYFLATADSGSIAAASLRLHISPASVSTAIAALEQRLNMQLFVRLPARGMQLTPAGERFAVQARSLIASAEELQLFAHGLGNEIQGEMSVACFTNLAPVHLANLLAQFSRRHPYVRFSVCVADQEDILNGLRMGHFELALTFNLGLSDQFKWTTLAVLPPKIVLPARHRLAVSSEISLEQVAEEPLILMDLPHTRDYFLSLFHSQRLVPKLGLCSSSFETVRTLVGSGLGYSLLNLEPRIHTTYDGTRVVYRPVKERLLPLEIGCLELNGFQQRRIGAAFIDFTSRFFERKHTAQDQNGLQAL